MAVAVVAAIAGLLVVLLAIPALLIDEAPAGGDIRAHVRLMLRDIRSALKMRSVWVAFVFFLSPVGAAALMQLFSAVAVDYSASPTIVIWIIGVGSGVLTAVGALIGGWMCDRTDRWVIYPVGGLLSALCAGTMALAPLTPMTYAIGASACSLASGFCYAAFTALALDLLGAGGPASATRYALFAAAENIPIAYMTWLDGVGHTRFGPRGLLAVDAVANAAFGLLLLIALQRLWGVMRYPEPCRWAFVSFVSLCG